MWHIFPRFTAEPEFWLLLVPAVFAAFMLGYVLRRRRQKIVLSRPSGLSSVLAGASNQAVSVLEKAETLTPDSLRTYLALGSLFRERGEFDRATHIHRAITRRPDIRDEDMADAYVELGHDYMVAGLMDHAEEHFNKALELAVYDKRQQAPVLRALAQMYERQQRWADALAVWQRITHKSKAEVSQLAQAHLLAKMGEQALLAGDEKGAKKHFENATKHSQTCLPAWQNLMRLHLKNSDMNSFIADIKGLLSHRAELFHVCEGELLDAIDKYPEYTRSLEDIWHKAAVSPHTHWRTAAGYARFLQLKDSHKKAILVLRAATENHPLSLEPAHALATAMSKQGEDKQALEMLQERLHTKSKTHMHYMCNQCGYASQRVFWKCPQCQKWDALTPLTLGKAS